MKGGDHDRIPDDYISNQRSVNTYHSHGELENASDWDTAHLAAKIAAPYKSVLIVGCRTGYEVDCIANEYPEKTVLGVDIVSEFVSIAKNRGVKALVADMHDLPFVDNKFECVICIGTFEHAYNIEKAASELLRVASKRVHVTADLESHEDNPSHYARTTDYQEWIDLFDMADRKHNKPSWRILSRTSDKSVHIDLISNQKLTSEDNGT